MLVSYAPLEGDFIQSISGKPIGFSTDKTPSFFDASSFIYAFALTVIIVTASFRYAYAGMLRMQASEEGIKKSKEEFKRVTYGLLGVLGLWLILATVNKDMLTGDVTLSNLRAEQIGTENSEINIDPIKPTPTPTQTNGSETANREIFKGKIGINRPACVGANTTCTNVASMPEATIKMLFDLKAKCPTAAITITGGTEPGHQSHGPGLSPVDLSLNNTQLNTCIESFTKGPDKSFCKITYTNFGYIFCNEKGVPHWHVYK